MTDQRLSLSYAPHPYVISYIMAYSPPTKLGGGRALVKATSPSTTHVIIAEFFKS